MARPWKKQCRNCGRFKTGVREVVTHAGRMLLCRDCRGKL